MVTTHSLPAAVGAPSTATNGTDLASHAPGRPGPATVTTGGGAA